jgi:hypothetical protein
MSYTVNVTNNSAVELQTGDGKTVAPHGGTWTSGVLGNSSVGSDMFGTLLFVDIADQHIPGDSSETWGVLVRYHETAVVGRYEGGGQLDVIFNEYLQASLTGMDLRQVWLPNVILGGVAVAPAG